MGALRNVGTWRMDFNVANDTYSIVDDDGATFKTVNLRNYSGEIRFIDIKLKASGVNTNNFGFNAEGLGTKDTVTIRLRNSRGTISSIDVLRTGAIRAN